MLVFMGAFIFIITILVSSFLFEWTIGIAFVVILAFGMLFSIHQRTKAMHNDMLLIKAKLGVSMTTKEEYQLEKRKIDQSLSLTEENQDDK